jgi:hypothetical protein
MQVLYSPQFNDVDSISYEFVGEKIICTLNGEVDEFDFTACPKGYLERDTEKILSKPL